MCQRSAQTSESVKEGKEIKEELVGEAKPLGTRSRNAKVSVDGNPLPSCVTAGKTDALEVLKSGAVKIRFLRDTGGLAEDCNVREFLISSGNTNIRISILPLTGKVSMNSI